MTLYNKKGKAAAYIENDVIWTFDGRAVAYLFQEAVYNFPGKQLGWFEKGWLRDMAGYCVLFTPQAFAGPARPSMETTPAKYAKKALPSKRSREMRKAKMAYQAHWSEKEGIDTDV